VRARGARLRAGLLDRPEDLRDEPERERRLGDVDCARDHHVELGAVEQPRRRRPRVADTAGIRYSGDMNRDGA
jgi:hypothetical protein